MGSRLKALSIALAVLILLFAVLWNVAGLPAFTDWLANASEAEASFWGAIIGALSSGLVAITILAADIDHRDRQNISRRLSLARALKAEIADALVGLNAGLMNIEAQVQMRGQEIPTTKLSALYADRPLIASPPEAIYELGEEIGRLFAHLRTMFIRVGINSDGFTYHPETRAPLLEDSIKGATLVGSLLLAAIDEIDGESHDLSAHQWRERIVKDAKKFFNEAQKVRARSKPAS